MRQRKSETPRNPAPDLAPRPDPATIHPMAQDWITTLDHDFGGLHPESAASIKRFLESLRGGFAGAFAPAEPVVGQTWVDTSGATPTPRVYDGSTWRIVRAEPAATAPVAGVVRQAVFPGSGNGDVTIFEAVTEVTELLDDAKTDTVIEIPAGARVRSVVGRVLATTNGAASFAVGVTAAATRFGTGISLTAGTVFRAYGDETVYASATPLVITPNDVPIDTDGRIRIVLNYELATTPTA